MGHNLPSKFRFYDDDPKWRGDMGDMSGHLGHVPEKVTLFRHFLGGGDMKRDMDGAKVSWGHEGTMAFRPCPFVPSMLA
jgi:hypothetical protein